MAICTDRNINKEIAEALEIDNVIKINLTFEVGAIPSVEATFCPDEKQLKNITNVLKKYRLEEIKSKQCPFVLSEEEEKILNFEPDSPELKKIKTIQVLLNKMVPIIERLDTEK